MDGWIGGGGGKKHFKNCLQQSKRVERERDRLSKAHNKKTKTDFTY